MPRFNYHKRIEELTEIQLQYEDSYKIITHTMEELGECAGAMCVEDAGVGKSYKGEVKESSAEEAVDVAICALSLFYARGGNKEMFIDIMKKKLNKWETNQNSSIQDR
jgi:NTP pyrophosphatase (non-canonical NTP hydrolase)